MAAVCRICFSADETAIVTAGMYVRVHDFRCEACEDQVAIERGDLGVGK